MATANRAEAVELFRAAFDATGKYSRNCNKLTLMSMTSGGRFAFEQYGDQLEAMKAAADAARDRFTEAVAGWPADEIASVVIEVATPHLAVAA